MGKLITCKNNNIVGDKFENTVLYEWILKKYPNDIIERNFYFSELGVELDFVGKRNNEIAWVAEAKGGEDRKWNKGGGARRTDNAKKAIINLIYVKKLLPKTKTFCFFTFEPKKGNSADLMLQNALKWKWIDEIIYIEPKTESCILENFYG